MLSPAVVWLKFEIWCCYRYCKTLKSAFWKGCCKGIRKFSESIVVTAIKILQNPTQDLQNEVRKTGHAPIAMDTPPKRFNLRKLLCCDGKTTPREAKQLKSTNGLDLLFQKWYTSMASDRKAMERRERFLSYTTVHLALPSRLPFVKDPPWDRDSNDSYLMDTSGNSHSILKVSRNDPY